jgi:hypothetical protein
VVRVVSRHKRVAESERYGCAAFHHIYLAIVAVVDMETVQDGVVVGLLRLLPETTAAKVERATREDVRMVCVPLKLLLHLGKNRDIPTREGAKDVDLTPYAENRHQLAEEINARRLGRVRGGRRVVAVPPRLLLVGKRHLHRLESDVVDLCVQRMLEHFGEQDLARSIAAFTLPPCPPVHPYAARRRRRTTYV